MGKPQHPAQKASKANMALKVSSGKESLVLKHNLRSLISMYTPLHSPKLEILKTCEETTVIGVIRLPVRKAYSIAGREEAER